MHFVLSSFSLYPELQITKDGSHSVPESSISYPKSHCKPSRMHLILLSISIVKPGGQLVPHVKLANK
jgi:hypothetical protein